MIVTMMGVALFFVQPATAQEAFDALRIKGEITYGEATMGDVVVELWEGNKVVESFETKKNGKFKFSLQNGQIYTIQLTKEGFYTKRISVDTRLPKDVEDSYDFEFDINIDALADKRYDEAVAEYPSALIAYDPRKDAFFFDKNYTKAYFHDIERGN